MAKVEKLIAQVNTELIGSFKYAHDKIVQESEVKNFKSLEEKEKAINNACAKIPLKEMTTEIFNKENGLKLISFTEYHALKCNKYKDEGPKLIYRINRSDNDYAIMTGLYIGMINIGKHQLEIKTQYSDLFLRRILNFCFGIYVDINISDSNNNSEGLYSLIVQYLFLVSLRKVAKTNLPKRYVYNKDRDYSIRGNVDIERYINHDLSASDKKISFKYPERENIKKNNRCFIQCFKRL